MSAMLDRRFHEAAAGASHTLFTLVVRPPSNWHWIEGRGRFHEKLRDNIKRKHGCNFAYRYFGEFDADQRVHSHYVVMTDAPLNVAGIKAVFRDLLAKVWERIGPDMPPSLRDGHEDFFWDTPRWLAITATDPLDWSVYCDTPRSLAALARYLPKNLRDRSGVQPVPDGWPLRTRGGRGFFGQPMADYWRETYRAWYSPPEAPPVDERHAQDDEHDGHDGAGEPDRTTDDPAPAVAAGMVSPRPARPVWNQPHASPAALSRAGVARAPPAARTRNNYTHNTKEMMAWTI